MAVIEYEQKTTRTTHRLPRKSIYLW
jgi:hypothetical protein